MADFESLKGKRKTARRLTTLSLRDLERRIVECDVQEAKKSYLKCKTNYNEFVEVHNLILDDDESEDQYGLEMHDSYKKVMLMYNNFIEYNVKFDANNVMKQSNVMINLPPTPKPDVFYGTSDAYPTWKAQFNILVGNKNIEPGEKMFFLKEYTAGPAREAIEALLLLPNEESYVAAISILEERFGDPSKVCSAFRRKLEEWPKISAKDGPALRKLSDFLTQLAVAKKSYPPLNILDDEFENKKILSKLPGYLVERWIERVVEYDDFPSFETFALFIKEKANIANHSLRESIDPLGGPNGRRENKHDKHGLPNTLSNTRTLKVEGRVSELADANRPQAKASDTCPLCSKGHALSVCSFFVNSSLDERKRIISEKKLCFACLKPGHRRNACRQREKCSVCSRFHPTLLHEFSITHASQMGERVSPYVDRSTTMVLPVCLRHKSTNKSTIVYALLDTQSNTNFISSEVAELLDLPSRKTSLTLSTMSGKSRIPTQAVDGLEIKGATEKTVISLPTCYTRSTIPGNKGSIPTRSLTKSLPHLSSVELPPFFENAPIGLLLGYHTTEAFRPLDVVTGAVGSPFGLKTPLGWCVMGSLGSESTDDLGVSIVQGCISLRSDCRESKVDSDLGPHEMDLLGHSYSQEDAMFVKILKEEMIRRDDKHYECPLPLKSDLPFPCNRFVAEKRLNSLKTKFMDNPNYFTRYKEVMSDMIESGFAEAVPNCTPCTQNRVWYIPHHSVDQGKIRIVFDCSVKVKGVCLNERLLQGPDMINSLIGIILRFRQKPVAITCDIEKLYHQFSVAERDRDLLRFLWFENGEISGKPTDYRMCVHLFGATSSPGVATFGLRRIAEDFGQFHSKESVRFVKRDFYVDDGVTSVDSPLQACDLISETRKLLSHGGLRCHKIMSNSSEVLEASPP